MQCGWRKISESSTVLAATLALALPADPAHAACYADPVKLEAAVKVIGASFKCPAFRQAIFGERVSVFFRDAGILDQMTGSCQAEIATVVEHSSADVLRDEARFCQGVEDLLAADAILRAATRAAGAR